MNTTFFNSLVFQNTVSDLILKLNNKTPCSFVIYGTGTHSLELIKCLTSNNLTPKAILYDELVDPDPGNFVFPLKQIKDINKFQFDYVLISSLAFQFNMAKKLMNHNVSPEKILRLYSDDIFFHDLWHRLQSVSTFYFCYENCYDLFNLSKKIDRGNIVEIGSWAGRSTIALGTYASLNNSKTFSIDPWFNKYGDVEIVSDLNIFQEWQNNINLFGIHDVVKPLMGSSSEIIKSWDKKTLIDILFIDGEHRYKDTIFTINEKDIEEYKIKGFNINGKFHDYHKLKEVRLPVFGVKVDYDLWSPLIKRGGYIALHDINSEEHPAVDRVWNEEITSNPEKWSIISKRNNLGIAKKLS